LSLAPAFHNPEIRIWLDGFRPTRYFDDMSKRRAFGGQVRFKGLEALWWSFDMNRYPGSRIGHLAFQIVLIGKFVDKGSKTDSLNNAVHINSSGCSVVRHNGINGVVSGWGWLTNCGVWKCNYTLYAQIFLSSGWILFSLPRRSPRATDPESPEPPLHRVLRWQSRRAR